MKSIVNISDLPNELSIDELLEVKGGLVDNNKLCSIFNSAVKCTVAGSGLCTVAGSGIIIDQPVPNPEPTPGPLPPDNG